MSKERNMLYRLIDAVLGQTEDDAPPAPDEQPPAEEEPTPEPVAGESLKPFSLSDDDVKRVASAVKDMLADDAPAPEADVEPEPEPEPTPEPEAETPEEPADPPAPEVEASDEDRIAALEAMVAKLSGKQPVRSDQDPIESQPREVEEADQETGDLLGMRPFLERTMGKRARTVR